VSDELKDAGTEVERCRRAVEKGSPVYFWINRLTSYAKRLEAAVVILRMQIAALENGGRLSHLAEKGGGE
jgi:hypothetical protein